MFKIIILAIFAVGIKISLIMKKSLSLILLAMCLGLGGSAQISQEQLRTGSDEQLLREWTRELSHDDFG